MDNVLVEKERKKKKFLKHIMIDSLVVETEASKKR